MKRKRSREKLRERSKRARIFHVQKKEITQPHVTKSEHLSGTVETEFSSKQFSTWNTLIKDPTKSGDTAIIRYYPNLLKVEDVNRLDKWIQSTGMTLSKKTNDCRGEHQVVSLGIWTQQGHDTIHFTPSSRNELGRDFILDNSNQTIWNQICNKVQKDFPQTCAKLKDLDQRVRKFDLFSFLICNVTQVKKEHRDGNDHNLCVVIPTSDFTGGELFFRYLNYKFVVKKGDVLAFNSRELWHGVMDSIGNRRSIVLTTHNSLIRVAELRNDLAKFSDTLFK